MEKKENQKLSPYIMMMHAILMLCIYPLYFDDGYYNIGLAKYRFFLAAYISTFIVMLIAIFIDLLAEKKKGHITFSVKNISITEKFLYGYMAIIVLSYVLSDFKEDILWGARDWYMGTLSLLLIGVLTLFYMYQWETPKWLLSMFLMVNAGVFLLGICNRFSFYPIPIEPHQPAFISTLGNINWFCSYMSVMSPVGIGLFVFTEDNEYKYGWQKGLLFCYVLITFITGFCQGSSSVLLWYGALFFVLFCILFTNIHSLKKWLLLVGIWGLSGQMVRFLKTVFSERYNYDSPLFVESNLMLLFTLAVIILYLIFNFYGREEREFPAAVQRRVCSVIIGAVVIIFLLWLVLAVYHTKVGISFLENSSLFLLNDPWGNGRGIIYRVTFEMWDQMSWQQKLFGVGADGFCSFAYSIPEIKQSLQSYFGNSVLTNAHCEILTNLINFGILGVSAYLGIFITFIKRCMEKGKTHNKAYIPVLCVVCYFANNMISFAQVLNFPFLFLILGMGEACLKKEQVMDNERKGEK